MPEAAVTSSKNGGPAGPSEAAVGTGAVGFGLHAADRMQNAEVRRQNAECGIQGRPSRFRIPRSDFRMGLAHQSEPSTFPSEGWMAFAQVVAETLVPTSGTDPSPMPTRMPPA